MKSIRIKKEFASDWISREAGERLRLMILKESKLGKITLDFSDCIIASTSFFDEGLAKLVHEGWTWERLCERVDIVHMDDKDRLLLQTIWKNRAKRK